MNRVLLADAVGYSPSSSGFRDLVTASGRYGLTEGSYAAENIELTPLGESVSRPRNEAERADALREAVRHVPIFAQMLSHFANNKLPEAAFLKNTLERPPFNVDPVWSEAVARTFIADAERVGYVRRLSGSLYVVLDAGTTMPEEVVVIPDDHQPDTSVFDEPPVMSGEAEHVPVPEPETDRPLPMQLFVAHGRNRKPLEQLQRILNEWQVPFVVAVNEANAGRPISQKVADLMMACSAGIFIFTGDEEFQDGDGNSVLRPSQNVIYELGAASLLYGRKIVIFKEEGVTFPSDFSDLGWIEFKKDALDQKSMELLREMIALKAVKLVSATAAG
jgi:hypothetical protein